MYTYASSSLVSEKILHEDEVKRERRKRDRERTVAAFFFFVNVDSIQLLSLSPSLLLLSWKQRFSYFFFVVQRAEFYLYIIFSLSLS